MINNLLICAKQTILDKLGEAGIVVLIGVAMVFLVLFLLIGVVKLLQYINKLLNNWDDMMAIYRANKAERKAIKQTYINDRDDKITALYKQLDNNEISKIEFKQAQSQIKLEYKSKKPEIKQAINELRASQKQARLPKPEQAKMLVAPVEEVVTDAKLIAIISAAIAVATEEEQQERKVTFKVRSIKQIH
ncbi:MAG: OadG family protein [Clostridia bacterium]|nr:OadG family protein [Clostridia bacterium]